MTRPFTTAGQQFPAPRPSGSPVFAKQSLKRLPVRRVLCLRNRPSRDPLPPETSSQISLRHGLQIEWPMGSMSPTDNLNDY